MPVADGPLAPPRKESAAAEHEPRGWGDEMFTVLGRKVERAT